jgi:hypothetical protein
LVTNVLLTDGLLANGLLANGLLADAVDLGPLKVTDFPAQHQHPQQQSRRRAIEQGAASSRSGAMQLLGRQPAAPAGQ